MGTTKDRDDLLDLIDAYIESRLTDTEAERLRQRLEEDETARLIYVEYLDLYSELLRVAGYQPAYESFSTTALTQTLAKRSRRSLLLAVTSGFLVTVLAAVLLSGWGRSSLLENSRTVAGKQGVAKPELVVGKIAGEQQPVLAGQRVEIDAGVTEIQLQNGVRCVLEGPAQILFSSVSEGVLDSGTVVAYVPPQAVGFSLETADLRVVDFGTTFGLSVDPAEASQVHVMDGLVSVLAKAPKQTQQATQSKQAESGQQPVLLRAGEGLKISRATETAASVQESLTAKVAPPRFASGLNHLRGIQSIVGSIQLLSPLPASVETRQLVDDEAIQLICEQTGKELASSIFVVSPAPRVILAPENLEEIELPPGTQYSSYLLHCQSDKTPHLEGTISFHRPILGVIFTSERLFETDPVCGAPAMLYPDWEQHQSFNLSRGAVVSFNGIQETDMVQLHEDGKTLTVRLHGTGRNSDHVRILVEDSQE